MKKTLFTMTLICATCSMLSASAWAQSEIGNGQPADSDSVKRGQNQMQNQNQGVIEYESPSESPRSEVWTSRHLSSTGRTTPFRTTKITGAAVNDASGNRIGQIEDLLVNPGSGRIDFAVISLNNAGASISSSPESSTLNSTTAGQRLVPVPWSLLRPGPTDTSAGAMQQPTFTLNVSQDKLNQAPTIDRDSWANISDSSWRRSVYSYYGIEAGSSTGAAESPSGSTQGAGAQKLEQPPSENP